MEAGSPEHVQGLGDVACCLEVNQNMDEGVQLIDVFHVCPCQDSRDTGVFMDDSEFHSS